MIEFCLAGYKEINMIKWGNAFKKKKLYIEKEIAVFWREDNFIVYDWPEYINTYPYTLSIFEMEEKSFNADVTKVFIEIADVITKGAWVKHLPEKERQEFSFLGIHKELLQQQIDTYHGWDETELYCYLSNNELNIDNDSECDLYIMIDVIHANMTIKCRNRDLFLKAKNCMKDIIGDLNYNLENWELSES